MMEGLQRQRSDISDHLETLRFLVAELGLYDVLELGVRTGNSTLALLLAVKEREGLLVSVDRDPCLQAKQLVHDCDLEEWWAFEQTDALTWDGKFSQPIYRTMTTYDLIFVDLDHSYDETKAVLARYTPQVVSDGVVAFHDTVSRPEVLKALREFLAANDGWREYHWLNCSGLMILRRMQCS